MRFQQVLEEIIRTLKAELGTVAAMHFPAVACQSISTRL